MAYATTQPSTVHRGPDLEHAGSAAAITMTILRLVVGVVMVAHGWMKLMDVSAFQGQLEQLGMPLPATFALISTAAEFLGGLGLIVGLLTRIAAFGVFCNMAVAIYLVHLPHGLLASNNGFEYPLTLMCAALFFLAAGAGPISLDAKIARGVRERRERTRGEPTYERPVVEGPEQGPPRGVPEGTFHAGDAPSDEAFPASDPRSRLRPSQPDDPRYHR